MTRKERFINDFYKELVGGRDIIVFVEEVNGRQCIMQELVKINRFTDLDVIDEFLFALDKMTDDLEKRKKNGNILKIKNWKFIRSIKITRA